LHCCAAGAASLQQEEQIALLRQSMQVEPRLREQFQKAQVGVFSACRKLLVLANSRV
jgi:hypothetical protein